MSVALFAAYLLPNHYFPWLSFHQEALAFVAFAPLILLCSLNSKKLHLGSLFVFCLALVPLIQFFFGKIVFFSDAIINFLYLMAFAFVINIGVALGEDERKYLIRKFWICLLFSALFSSALGLCQWLLLYRENIYIAEMPMGWRPFANLAQPNHFSTLLILGLVSVWYFYKKSEISAFIATSAASVLILGIIASGSRTAVLSLTAIIFINIFLNIKNRELTKELFLFYFFAFFLFGSFCWNWFNNYLLLSNIDGGGAVRRLAINDSRLVYWRDVVSVFEELPFFGVGWGQIGLMQIKYREYFYNLGEYFESAHNILIDLILYNGWIVGFFCISILVLFFYKKIFFARNLEQKCCLSALIAVICHAMVEYPLNYSYFLLPFGLMIGFISYDQNKLILSLKVNLRIFGLLCAAVWIVLMIRIAFEYFHVESQWRLMQFKNSKIQTSEKIDVEKLLLLDGFKRLLKYSENSERKFGNDNDIAHLIDRYPYEFLLKKYRNELLESGNFTQADAISIRICDLYGKKSCGGVSTE